MAVTATTFTPAETDTLTISAGAFLGSSAAHFFGSSATVVEIRPKAVKVEGITARGKRVTAWFPRKVLQVIGAPSVIGNNQHWTLALAPWFKADDWTARFLDLTMGASAIQA